MTLSSITDLLEVASHPSDQYFKDEGGYNNVLEMKIQRKAGSGNAALHLYCYLRICDNDTESVSQAHLTLLTNGTPLDNYHYVLKPEEDEMTIKFQIRIISRRNGKSVNYCLAVAIVDPESGEVTKFNLDSYLVSTPILVLSKRRIGISDTITPGESPHNMDFLYKQITATKRRLDEVENVNRHLHSRLNPSIIDL